MKPLLLILAGGKSERFWPLSEKNLFPMFGKPLLFWQLKHLYDLGFREAIVVANDAVYAWKNEAQKLFPDFTLVFVMQNETVHGMGGAVLSAKDLYQRKFSGKSIYLIGANDICEEKLHRSILTAFEKKKVDALIAGYKTKEYLPLGYLVVQKGRLMRIVEKPSFDAVPSDLVNIVAHCFIKPDELFNAIEKEYEKDITTDDHYERALDKLMKQRNFQIVPYDGEWKILKYPWHMLSVTAFYLQTIQKPSIGKKADISPRAEVVGNVVIEDSVRIFSGAKVVGPCFIGEGTIIGNNAMVRESMIGKNCVIGFSSDITRSYLGNDCWTHTNYIGDSVLESNISLGSGSVTGNLRLDETTIFSSVRGQKVDTHIKKLGMIAGCGARFGINASIMPGVKIGRDSFVGAGVVLDRDVPDKQFCTVAQELIVKENRTSAAIGARSDFRKKL